MADSPSKYADRILACAVYADGTRLDSSYELISARIRFELNRIGKATLCFNAMPADSQEGNVVDCLSPGTSIRLDAGDLNDRKTIFDGIVLRTGMRIVRGHRPVAVVECRDCAWPATQGRHNRIFRNRKDSEMISEVLSGYESVTVDGTGYSHPEMVQYYCTDWDFAVSRADACGMFVLTMGCTIKVFRPEVNAAPVLTLTLGSDLVEFDCSLKADDSFSDYAAVSWNPAEQKSTGVSVSNPPLNSQGDMEMAELADDRDMLLQTDAPVSADVLKAWADSMALKAGLARYRGKVCFYGAAEVVPGCTIELKGFGKRFNGNAFIGSVTHVIENNEWITEAGIGIEASCITDEPDVAAPYAAGLLPGMSGLHTAVVSKLDGDPADESRIQVELPWLVGDNKQLWARLATMYGSDGAGAQWLPEPNDEVLVEFVDNDPSHPVVIGSVYSARHRPPYEYTAANHMKAFVTREQLKLEFNDEKKSIVCSTPGGNSVALSDDGKSVVLSDANGNEVRLDKDGISLKSVKDIRLTAKGNITMDAAMKMDCTARHDASISGLNVTVPGKMGATVKGNATAELSATGQTTVKGAMVMIN